MAKKEMTEKQLNALCLRDDAKNLALRQREVRRLTWAMNSKGFRFFEWELEEVKRMVHCAYGRAQLDQ